jgi:hypothetical protein
VVLHHVTNDSYVIKIPAAAFRTERFFENNLHRLDVLAIPKGLEDRVRKAQDHQILNHLLAKVMVNTV